jgi:hypothetical protein
MLLEIFQATTVNIKQKQDTHGMRLGDDRVNNRTKSGASVLVCRIEFRSFKGTCMLLESLQATTVNTKQKQDTHGMRLVDDRVDNRTKSDGARLENLISAVYRYLHAPSKKIHAPRNISGHHREHQAKTRHAWHAAHRSKNSSSDPHRSMEQIMSCLSAGE